tara:strand:- start:136 stop:279 length:144 start_codon:yes stop_codon:yes gene_type:complete
VTPAVEAAKSAGIDFQIREYEHSPNAESYGLEAVHIACTAATWQAFA